ncbi:alpha/beta fold hydrolase [Ornithinicoccus halotolerans]|uniref:alpha/beta fold hydrolase n=1 Tax=Ornithinicoccus halotolerans TaxID=1748220 RepID=UPI001E5C5124|nr:alpha/beta fold hydrolase [Ornithinicoccus halotolerans]
MAQQPWASAGQPSSPGPPMPSVAGVRHRFVDLPALRVHVAEAGLDRADRSRPPVVLLHGVPQHWWEWRGVIPELATSHHVICPDLRGAGWTDAPPSGYRRPVLMSDVWDLLDALGQDRVHLVAHDWGALLAFELALARPDRVASLVSISVPHPWQRLTPRMLPLLLRAGYQLPMVTPWLGPRLLSRGEQRLPRRLLTATSTRPEIWTPEVVAAFVDVLRDPARARAVTALYRHFIQPEAARFLGGAHRDARLEQPVRVLVGAQDPLVRPADLDRQVSNAPRLRVVAVEGASHWVVDERPDAVVAVVRETVAAAELR